MNYLLIVGAFLVLLVFFRGGQTVESMPPVSGVIWPPKAGEARPATDHVVFEEVRQVAPAEPNGELPTLELASDSAVPERFIGVLKPDAELEIRRRQASSRLARPAKAGSPAKVSQKKEAQSGLVEKPVPAHIVYDFNVLNSVVRNSQSSYFFAAKTEAIRNVTVRVVSITPYKNSDILTIEVTNEQNDYFFLEGAAVYQDSRDLGARFFMDPLVAPGKTQTILALLPRLSRANLTLVLSESAGQGRRFKVDFVTT